MDLVHLLVMLCDAYVTVSLQYKYIYTYTATSASYHIHQQHHQHQHLIIYNLRVSYYVYYVDGVEDMVYDLGSVVHGGDVDVDDAEVNDEDNVDDDVL